MNYQNSDSRNLELFITQEHDSKFDLTFIMTILIDKFLMAFIKQFIAFVCVSLLLASSLHAFDECHEEPTTQQEHCCLVCNTCHPKANLQENVKFADDQIITLDRMIPTGTSAIEDVYIEGPTEPPRH